MLYSISLSQYVEYNIVTTEYDTRTTREMGGKHAIWSQEDTDQVDFLLYTGA